jgi:hypothetical protein
MISPELTHRYPAPKGLHVERPGAEPGRREEGGEGRREGEERQRLLAEMQRNPLMDDVFERAIMQVWEEGRKE